MTHVHARAWEGCLSNSCLCSALPVPRRGRCGSRVRREEETKQSTHTHMLTSLQDWRRKTENGLQLQREEFVNIEELAHRCL